MARDSQTVAAELIDVVLRAIEDPDKCRKLIALRLEGIYDYAYALGYATGKQFTRDFAYDLGFADGFKKAAHTLDELKLSQKALTAGQPAAAAQQQAQPAAAAAPPPAPRAPSKRALYHLPCKVCGSLYTEDECPVCKARAQMSN